MIIGDLGYFARDPGVAKGAEYVWTSVEFNLNQFCWVKICWIIDGPGDRLSQRPVPSTYQD